LLGVVRDFKGRGASAADDASDDFEGPFWGSGPTVGLVSTLFINGNLAVDLGGLHAQATGSVSLDAQASPFGIVTGGTYNLDLFQADRHSKCSDFRVDTNLSFVSCGTVPPDVTVR
jgi:fibro-slime domain-containing protein